MGRHVAGYWVLLVIGALLAQAVHADDWPKDASGRPASGEAMVQVTVDPDGHASHARIVRTTGNADLDRKALSVVEAHAFNPPVQHGTRRSVEAIVPVKLDPSGAAVAHAPVAPQA